MNEPETIHLITETKRGKPIKVPVTIQTVKGRIEFLKSPFAMKDELKAMAGSRWHGFDDNNPRKIWSVADCTRNRFQLDFMQGRNPYTRWEKPLVEHDYERPLRAHQRLMANFGLTYHYCILAAEMGTGKTLSAIEIIERSECENWWWAGPKSALKAVEREFEKWGLNGVNLKMMTYEALLSKVKNWTPGDRPPHGVVFDESSRLKNHMAKRSQAAQHLADGIREAYGNDGFVIEMSGTPAPKSPVDFWSQCEIAAPGFLREGSMKAFERRLGIFVEKETSQGRHLQRVTWLDDEDKCAICGGYEDEEQHVQECYSDDYHQWEPSINEVAYLNKRLQGLVLILHKKDCLDLPEKIYRTVECTPTPTTERVAKALVKLAPNAMTALTWLRELSDGFQYREEVEGVDLCPVCAKGDTPGKAEVWCDPEDAERVFEMTDMLDPAYVLTLEKKLIECPTCGGSAEVPHRVRVTREVPSPKDRALVELLDEYEDLGRLVVFAGFKASIDRVTKLCLRQKWSVVRVDGRGWKTFDMNGIYLLKEDPLKYWADTHGNRRVAFVAHPQSGGMGLTLTEARAAVFFSNDFRPESRIQAEDRIHRLGTNVNRGATIIDLLHLQTDAKVRDVLKANRRLELMTLGDLEASVGVSDED